MKSATATAVLFFLLGGILASALSYYTFDISLSKYTSLYGKSETLRGTVTDIVWDGGYSATYIVNVSSAGEFSDFTCVLTGNGGISENSNISCKAEFSPLTSSPQFDERRYYLSRKIICSSSAESITVTGDAGFSLSHLAKTVNRKLSDVFEDLLGKEEGAFASALLLGNKDGLSDTVNRDFIRLGISHVLAISGMHLTILCAFVNTFLKPLGKRAGQLGSILTVVFYMFITGLSPAVTRSGVMLLFLICASFLGKGCDRFTNLGISGFLICAVDPYSSADIGLQLSFAAVMAIFLYTEKRRELVPEKVELKKRHPVITMIRSLIVSFIEGAVMTVIIILFMLPLEWLYFGQICLISPIVSPIFSMLTTVLLWALPILLLLSPAPTFASLFAIPVEKLIAFICDLANLFSRLRNISVSIDYSFAPYFSILIFIAIPYFASLKRKSVSYRQRSPLRSSSFSLFPALFTDCRTTTAR